MKYLWTIGLSLCCWLANAEVLHVDYASFYSHVKKLNKEETNLLRFAFGFQHVQTKELCQIESARIVTQKQTQPLIVEGGTRFTVPSDKVLKMAKAVVEIQLLEPSNLCDMSVQLETVPEFLKTRYTFDELQQLLIQYQAFFSNMGSFLSFLMPSAEGLTLQYPDLSKVPSDLQYLANSNGFITLDETWFEQKKDLQLNHVPIRITAFVVK